MYKSRASNICIKNNVKFKEKSKNTEKQKKVQAKSLTK